jgi:hypothetical protein
LLGAGVLPRQPRDPGSNITSSHPLKRETPGVTFQIAALESKRLHDQQSLTARPHHRRLSGVRVDAPWPGVMQRCPASLRSPMCSLPAVRRSASTSTRPLHCNFGCCCDWLCLHPNVACHCRVRVAANRPRPHIVASIGVMKEKYCCILIRSAAGQRIAEIDKVNWRQRARILEAGIVTTSGSPTPIHFFSPTTQFDHTRTAPN